MSIALDVIDPMIRDEATRMNKIAAKVGTDYADLGLASGGGIRLKALMDVKSKVLYYETVQLERIAAMGLKAKQETVFTCDYGDFDKWIEEELGRPFDIVVDMETSNDMTVELGASAETWHMESLVEKPDPFKSEDWKRVPGMSDYDLKTVRKFQETGEHCGAADILLQYLVDTGKAEPGTYMVRVCW